jgi:cysteinyl-tRNA synthetase
MACSLLGETVDIHLGGEDLLFPHHENEIAQSEVATGQPLARFWLHVKHLKVDDRKMSKSLGNFHTVRELVGEGYDPAAIRWVLLSAHYRSELNFTRDGLDDATVSVQRLLDFRRRVREAPPAPDRAGRLAAVARAHLGDFGRAMDQDLNAPRAMAALWSLARDVNVGLDEAAGGIADEDRDAVLAALAEMDAVLGVLDLAARGREVGDETEQWIRRTVEARDRARAERDFATADRLRDELAAEGVQLEDGPEGTRWKRVHVGAAAGGG